MIFQVTAIDDVKRHKKFQSHANCKPPLKSQHLQLNKFKKL